MTITTESTEPSTGTRRRVQRRRSWMFVAVVLVAVVVLGVADATAYRLTHIDISTSPYGAEVGVPAAYGEMAFGLGPVTVNNPGTVTFRGATATGGYGHLTIVSAFFVPGASKVGTQPPDTIPHELTATQLARRVAPGQQLYVVPADARGEFNPAGKVWQLIVIVRDDDRTGLASFTGVDLRFSAPWHHSRTINQTAVITFDGLPRSSTR